MVNCTWCNLFKCINKYEHNTIYKTTDFRLDFASFPINLHLLFLLQNLDQNLTLIEFGYHILVSQSSLWQSLFLLVVYMTLIILKTSQVYIIWCLRFDWNCLITIHRLYVWGQKSVQQSLAYQIISEWTSEYYYHLWWPLT